MDVKTPKKRRIVGRIAVILVVVIFLAGLLPACALHIFLNRHCDYKGIETVKYPMQGIYQAADYGLNEEVHRFDTADGETIWVSEIAVEQPKAVILYLSGIVQPSVTYFYGHAKLMQEQQIASFLIEVRAHGNSTGKQLGLGYTELADVRAVMDYLKSQEQYRDVPVIIQGVSMGGAVALNAFGQIADIDACIAMSAYGSFEAELDYLMQGLSLPKFVRDYENLWLCAVLKWNYGDTAVEVLNPCTQILHAAQRPVLLIACSGDTSVSVQNTWDISSMNPDAEVWIRDSWEHFIVKDCDFAHIEQDTEYCEHITAWIQENVLNKTESLETE